MQFYYAEDDRKLDIWTLKQFLKKLGVPLVNHTEV